jgi:beta-glucosidase
MQPAQPAADGGQTSGFPQGFAWGTATAAFQIEGAPREDGKGESIWDRFSHTPGAIRDGANADVACDHYHRWREDVALMAELAHNAYRFSIAWTRVLPAGRGAVNNAGLDFYERLADALLARGIAPYVTLYHWDLPQALQDAGGWRNRDTAAAFADYAGIVAARLGDRVRHWITHNEPQVVTNAGHLTGEMAPGVRDLAAWWPVSHHLLLAHGLAVPVLRAASAAGAQVGITLNLSPKVPASASAEDQRAAPLGDALFNRWFLDPLFRGTYPDEAAALLTRPDDLIQPGDLAAIQAPLDFLGVNYYTIERIRRNPALPGLVPQVAPEDGPGLTAMGWAVRPEGLGDLLIRLHREYQPPAMYVTENGAAYPDALAPDGQVVDPERTDYLRRHFAQARRALAAGVPLRGYFIWSLLDNFEWARGYIPRFGLAYTDYPTQRRIIKGSGRYFAAVARANGANVALPGTP